MWNVAASSCGVARKNGLLVAVSTTVQTHCAFSQMIAISFEYFPLSSSLSAYFDLLTNKDTVRRISLLSYRQWLDLLFSPVSTSAAVVSGSPSTVTYSPRTVSSGGSPLKVIRVPAGSVATAGAGGTQVCSLTLLQCLYSLGRFEQKLKADPQ